MTDLDLLSCSFLIIFQAICNRYVILLETTKLYYMRLYKKYKCNKLGSMVSTNLHICSFNLHNGQFGDIPPISDMDLSLHNAVVYSKNDSSRSKKPVIPDFSENPDNVNKNMEISSLNNEQTSNLTYKKRRVPDFDDTYYVVPPKRIKSNVIHKETGNNLDASPEECISQSFASSSNRETNESFQTVIRQWEVNCLANPHRNYTHCACITGAEYEQQYEYNKHNFSCLKYFDDEIAVIDQNICITSQHNFSCLKYFDDEIAVIDQNICITSQRIEDLHKEYRAVNNFSISNIINKEKRNETDLKNRYASLCDARNEIFNLYVNQKNSTKLNFDAELMPQSEINMIKINREMLNSFQNHYGM
ncbi:hypothetical protein QE152_g22461 [Popillia japonica]|uniref:Uncharacterized protein n=1 Tax=Popillia japonica TaxID=7064 RepID=A0AAW1KKD5_POPJA